MIMSMDGFQPTIMGILFVKKPMELSKVTIKNKYQCCEFFQSTIMVEDIQMTQHLDQDMTAMNF